jgi:hypothetical protein
MIVMEDWQAIGNGHTRSARFTVHRALRNAPLVFINLAWASHGIARYRPGSIATFDRSAPQRERLPIYWADIQCLLKFHAAACARIPQGAPARAYKCLKTGKI